MLSPQKIKDLEKQGYRIVGNHSCIKVCLWCKKSLIDKDACYKNKFYGIKSWQCVQMSVSLNTCTNRCLWCWRDIEFTVPKWNGPVDEPAEIIDGCIKAHTKYLMGFLGNKNTDKERFMEALKPRHFAISLISESTFYPKLPEFIDRLHERGLTSFLVTNGSNPEMLEKLLKHQPTQLYITLPAPNEEIFTKACNPLVKNGWQQIMKSLSLLKRFSCRKAIRLTLVKGVNMLNPEQYAEILKNADADFFEFKAYMHVGYSQQRLGIENMPLHEEIKRFAAEVGSKAGLKLVDEKPESRVVLLMRKDRKDRIMRFG